MSQKPTTHCLGLEPQARSPLTFDYCAKRGVYVALWKGLEIGTHAFHAKQPDRARVWKQQVATMVSSHVAMEGWKL